MEAVTGATARHRTVDPGRTSNRPYQWQAKLLGYGGLAVFAVVTPVAVIYALDYQLVQAAMSADPDPNPVTYESLRPEVRTAVDRALAGNGDWYRSALAAPIDIPFAFERDGYVYVLDLVERYHWNSWRGKLPLVPAIVGLVAMGVAIVNRARVRGVVPGD